MYLATVWNINVPKVLIVSSTYRTLTDRQTSKIKEEFPSYLGTSYSRHSQYQECFVFKPKWGGGVLLLFAASAGVSPPSSTAPG